MIVKKAKNSQYDTIMIAMTVIVISFGMCRSVRSAGAGVNGAL